jgi:hypothetical protein
VASAEPPLRLIDYLPISIQHLASNINPDESNEPRGFPCHSSLKNTMKNKLHFPGLKLGAHGLQFLFAARPDLVLNWSPKRKGAIHERCKA